MKQALMPVPLLPILLPGSIYTCAKPKIGMDELPVLPLKSTAGTVIIHGSFAGTVPAGLVHGSVMLGHELGLKRSLKALTTGPWLSLPGFVVIFWPME